MDEVKEVLKKEFNKTITIKIPPKPTTRNKNVYIWWKGTWGYSLQRHLFLRFGRMDLGPRDGDFAWPFTEVRLDIVFDLMSC